MKDGREVVEDQFTNLTGKMQSPPDPKEVTRVTMQDGILHSVVEKEIDIEEAVEDMKMEDDDEAENPRVKKQIARNHELPNVVHLLARQFDEILIKK